MHPEWPLIWNILDEPHPCILLLIVRTGERCRPIGVMTEKNDWECTWEFVKDFFCEPLCNIILQRSPRNSQFWWCPWCACDVTPLLLQNYAIFKQHYSPWRTFLLIFQNFISKIFRNSAIRSVKKFNEQFNEINLKFL